MKSIAITKQEANQTIFKFVKKYLDQAPLSFIEKLFRLKDVKVNKKRVTKSYVLSENDVVEIYISEKQYEDFYKKDKLPNVKIMPDIIYEDENIIIVNKPSGLLVHGDKTEKRITLTNIVLNYLSGKGEYLINQSTFTPALAHRIDRNTSGIVIFGKNIKALQELENLFKEHNKIHKYYLALVSGHLNSEGVINKALIKDENKSIVKLSSLKEGGKTAITQYRLIKKFTYCSLVEIKILTGRTHQIRVHFASINHPLLGDSKYGDFSLNKKFDREFAYNSQFLHAFKIKFDQIDGILSYLSKKEFIAELGKKEKQILEILKIQSEEGR